MNVTTKAMRFTFPTLVAAVLAATSQLLPACGGDDASSGGSSGAAGRDPNANCVKPGTPNDEQGLGGYCETNADCVVGKSVCTSAHGAPPDAWFCTRPCGDGSGCTPGLYCAQDPRGMACVPLVCGVLDAGADAGTRDAPMIPAKAKPDPASRPERTGNGSTPARATSPAGAASAPPASSVDIFNRRH